MGMELELFAQPWPLGDLVPLFCCFPVVACECPPDPVMFLRLVDNLGGRGSQWRVVSASADLLVALPDAANLLQAPDRSLCACGILL